MERGQKSRVRCKEALRPRASWGWKLGAVQVGRRGWEDRRGTGARRPGEELRPGELMTAGKGVDVARKLRQGAGHAPGGQASRRTWKQAY
jgi:hypothetical protein